MKPSYVLDFIAFMHNCCSCILVKSTQTNDRRTTRCQTELCACNRCNAHWRLTSPQHYIALHRLGRWVQCRSLDARLASIQMVRAHASCGPVNQQRARRPRTQSKSSPGGSLQMQTIEQTIQDSSVDVPICVTSCPLGTSRVTQMRVAGHLATIITTAPNDLEPQPNNFEMSTQARCTQSIRASPTYDHSNAPRRWSHHHMIQWIAHKW